jgi:3-oxoacyl-[acyl-carrier protein] reductase
MSETILVTGSSRGIGRAVALRLADEGFDIVLHCRHNRAAADTVADEIRRKGRQARVLQFDVRRRETAEQILEADMQAHEPYYGLVLNAGVTRDAALPMLSGEDWDLVLDTNLDGFYNVVKPCVMPMIRRRRPGRIVTMTSVSGLMGNRGQVNYSAAKAGLVGASKALAVELAKRRITVNCVAPGLIETEMTEELPLDRILPMIPQQRLGSAEEVAATVAFLCSAVAVYITRQVISVNGGMF